MATTAMDYEANGAYDGMLSTRLATPTFFLLPA